MKNLDIFDIGGLFAILFFFIGIIFNLHSIYKIKKSSKIRMNQIVNENRLIQSYIIMHQSIGDNVIPQMSVRSFSYAKINTLAHDFVRHEASNRIDVLDFDLKLIRSRSSLYDVTISNSVAHCNKSFVKPTLDMSLYC